MIKRKTPEEMLNRTTFFGVDAPNRFDLGMYYNLPVYSENYVDIVSIFSQHVHCDLDEIEVIKLGIRHRKGYTPLPITQSKLEKIAESNPTLFDFIDKLICEIGEENIISMNNTINIDLDTANKMSNIEQKGMEVAIRYGRQIHAEDIFIGGNLVDGTKYLKQMKSCKVNSSSSKFKIILESDDLFLEAAGRERVAPLEELKSKVRIKPDINDVVPKRRDSAIRSVKSLVTESNNDLFNLLFGAEKIRQIINPVEITDWFVLTDDKREGTLQQRKFIQKALGAEKIAVLTGPPGTGKTTTITELVLQIINKDPNARVLITSQTKVAVHNVIEKLVEGGFDKSFEGLDIVVIDSDTKNEVISDYISENRNKISRSNVVGATTGKALNNSAGLGREEGFESGIGRGYKKFEYYTKEFDYVIIDEASKTTLVDFAPVASLATKWIIVGDELQLPPTIDEMEISPAFKWFDRDLNSTLGDIAGKDKRMISYKLFNDLYTIVYANIKSKNEFERLFIIGGSQKHKDAILKYIGKRITNMKVVRKPSDIELGIPNIIWETDYSIEFQLENNNPHKVIFLPSSTLPRLNQFNFTNWKWTEATTIKEAASDDSEFKDNFINQISWRIVRKEGLIGGSENNPEIVKKINKFNEQIEELRKELKTFITDKHQDDTVDSLVNFAVRGLFSYISNRMQGNEAHEILKYQYRMKESIANASHKQVYKSQSLITDKGYERSDKKIESISKKVFGGHGSIIKKHDFIPPRNYINSEEVEQISKDIIGIINASSDNEASVMVMAFHKKQLQEIMSKLKKKKIIKNNRSVQYCGNIKLSFHTADEAQGKEADFTLISFGVSGRNYRVGFTDNIRRLNVIMTRAKTTRVLYINYKDNIKNHPLSDYLKEV